MVDILFGGKRSYQDDIAAVQGTHDVLIATVGARWKAVSVICEDAGDSNVKKGKNWHGGERRDSLVYWCGCIGAVSCSAG